MPQLDHRTDPFRLEHTRWQYSTCRFVASGALTRQVPHPALELGRAEVPPSPRLDAQES